jgi:hypothetical protein
LQEDAADKLFRTICARECEVRQSGDDDPALLVTGDGCGFEFVTTDDKPCVEAVILSVICHVVNCSMMSQIVE